MPKTDKTIIQILKVEDAKLGSNVDCVGKDMIGVLSQTTTKTTPKENDQAVYDLGVCSNTAGTLNEDIDANQIKIKFEVMLLEHANVTEGAKFWVGAGVVANPSMVWVGQIQMTTELPNPHRPKLILSLTRTETSAPDEG